MLRRIDAATELFGCVLENQVKPLTVAVVKEDGLAGIAPKDDVVDPIKLTKVICFGWPIAICEPVDKLNKGKTSEDARKPYITNTEGAR